MWTLTSTHIYYQYRIDYRYRIPLSNTDITYWYRLPISNTDIEYLYRIPISNTDTCYRYRLRLAGPPGAWMGSHVITMSTPNTNSIDIAVSAPTTPPISNIATWMTTSTTTSASPSSISAPMPTHRYRHHHHHHHHRYRHRYRFTDMSATLGVAVLGKRISD